MNKFFVAKVAISSVVYHADKLYSYIVPSDMIGEVAPGKRVLVPFGLYNKKKQAMVYEVTPFDEPLLNNKLKSIFAVLDKEPLLNTEMLELSLYMKKVYFCTLYDAVKCMIPSALNVKSKEYYILNLDKEKFNNSLNDIQRIIIDLMKNTKSKITKEFLINKLNFDFEEPLNDLLEKEFIFKKEKFLRTTNDLKQKIVSINENINIENFKLTRKQRLIIDLLLENECGLSIKEINYLIGVGASVVNNLLNKKILKESFEDLFRDPLKNLDTPTNKNEIKLSKEQSEVYLNLKNNYFLNKYNVSLLFGVTGSGKTSVFLRLIDDVINDGKSVIVMVPEIALTPQMITIFKSRFQDKVAIFHSGLSLGERLDEFKRVKLKKATIVVGTRSSVFAPVENLGLIVIDEEHEDTYKSDSAPRYHARDMAKYRCFFNNAMLLLSSATPSIESFFLSKEKKYSLFELNSRYGNVNLPEVNIVDMNKEIFDGNVSFLSKKLIENLKYNLSIGKQSILLLNRRGYNTFVKCRNCDEVIMCPNCSVPLNYHIKNNKLMCHHCGISLKVSTECPNCHKNNLKFLGFGTQKIEEELKNVIENCKILRMDTDSTLRKNSYHDKLMDFLAGKYDIIIGTQMIAKGLNFPNVTLAAVISIDQYLLSEDFKSDEKTFSLITQVVGRSGRFDTNGKAIIQTFSPDSKTINLAAKQDYKSFYDNEISMRKALLYPPFVELVVVFFVGSNEQRVKTAANNFFLELKNMINLSYKNFLVKIFGPSPNTILKVNNKYKYKIILKYRDKLTFRLLMKELLEDNSKSKLFNGVSLYVDINPNNLM